jgi:hypothetical protein
LFGYETLFPPFNSIAYLIKSIICSVFNSCNVNKPLTITPPKKNSFLIQKD